MTTAFQPNAFQVNPLAFQISQIGSGRSGVVRAWLIEETQKAIDEKRRREAPETKPAPAPVAKQKPRAPAPAKVRRPRPRAPEPDDAPFMPKLHRHVFGPTVWDMLRQIPEIPKVSPVILEAKRATAEVVKLDVERKKRAKSRRKRAAFLMLLAA